MQNEICKKKRPTDLFRIRRFNGAVLILVSYFVFIGAFESVWVLEMDSRGASNWQIGIAITCAALPIPLLSLKGGILAQRFGARRWAVGNLAIISILVSTFGLVEGVFALILITVITAGSEGLSLPAGPMLVSVSVPEERQAAAQGLAASMQVAAGALATIMAAAIYQTSNDTTAWIVTSSIMIVLITLGWILTKPPDGKPIKPGVPFDLKRRFFE